MKKILLIIVLALTLSGCEYDDRYPPEVTGIEITMEEIYEAGVPIPLEFSILPEAVDLGLFDDLFTVVINDVDNLGAYYEDMKLYVDSVGTFSFYLEHVNGVKSEEFTITTYYNGDVVAEMQKVYLDAMVIEYAMDYVCHDMDCDAKQSFTWNEVDVYTDFDTDYYDLEGNTVVAIFDVETNNWDIYLRAKNIGDYEWIGGAPRDFWSPQEQREHLTIKE